MAKTIWTIGHSSRPLADFLALLQGREIGSVADVRRHAGSRSFPWFGADSLTHALQACHIAYVPFPDLGGRRRASPDSRNTIWRNASFRAYADFMETAEFSAARTRLERLALDTRTAIMCAEAVWWRCHRAMIADAFKANGWCVLHIMDGGKLVEHPYTSAASIERGSLVYGTARGARPAAP
ncbi:MAG: DUF488 domain-containing protein [Gammaproteobacteria bacterium]|jgi:uncharacterized protein (DUF488 family)|nr:DUF488 domain-containing protein [Gammaproteobacteria bacterium]